MAVEKVSANRKAVMKVAIIDIDSKVGFLPELLKKANEAQSYYSFQVVYLPIPAGSVRADLERAKSLKTYLPRYQNLFRGVRKTLSVEYVCCLTNHIIEDDEDLNIFIAAVDSQDKVYLISTFELRKYCRAAEVSFAKGTLFLCLSALLMAYPGLTSHLETAKCLMDWCENRRDIIDGLKYMKFDHAFCRGKVKNVRQLEAIEKLLHLRSQ